MKANELMIGDYVGYLPTWENEDGTIQRDGNPNNPIICKVEMLGGSVAQLDNGEDNFDADDIELYPIPLTPEILEKNGIKLKEVGDNGISTPPEWRNRFEKWVLRTQWKDTFIWYDRTAKYWHLYDYMGAAKLLYVHELQHALRLCGIEKEIVL